MSYAEAKKMLKTCEQMVDKNGTAALRSAIQALQEITDALGQDMKGLKNRIGGIEAALEGLRLKDRS